MVPKINPVPRASLCRYFSKGAWQLWNISNSKWWSFGDPRCGKFWMGGTASTFPRDPKYPLEKGWSKYLPSKWSDVSGLVMITWHNLEQKHQDVRWIQLPSRTIFRGGPPPSATLPGNTVDGLLKGVNFTSIVPYSSRRLFPAGGTLEFPWLRQNSPYCWMVKRSFPTWDGFV